MRGRSWLFLVLLASVLPLRANDLSSEIIYKTLDRKAATFVPLSVLQRGLADAPMASEDRLYLADTLRTADANGNCAAEWSPSHRAATRPEDRSSLAQIVATSRRLFIGEVQEVVTGWSVSHDNAVTMIWVKPTRILQDPDGVLRESEYAFVIARGELHIDGKRLCNTGSRYAVPAKGDALLIDAGEPAGDGRLFAGAHYFPMAGDEITPMPFVDVLPFKTMRLDDAMAAAAQLRKGEQQ